MSAEILDPNSERGQQAIRNAAYLKPTTQGDPPPRPNFDGWAQDLASLRENLGFDNFVALIAEALATAYDQRGKEASAPSLEPNRVDPCGCRHKTEVFHTTTFCSAHRKEHFSK